MYTLEQYLEAAQHLRVALYEKKNIKDFGMINVRVSSDPEKAGLFLLNYEPECAFKKPHEWNIYERVSRGLILTTTEIVAFPFPKFFNFGEEVKSFNFSDVESVQVKHDGSLGIVFAYHGKIFVTTHGGLDSAQGIWATKFARETGYADDLLEHQGVMGVDAFSAWTRKTRLAEIIYPENRIVTDYGDVSKLETLAEYRFNQHDMMIEHIIPDSVEESADFNSTEDLTTFCHNNKNYNLEGFVVLLKNGQRVKFKTDAYLQIHRIRFAISRNKIREILLDNPELLDDWKKTLPNEFFDEVDEIKKSILSEAYKKLVYVQEVLLDETFGVHSEEFSKKEYKERKKLVAEHFRANNLNHEQMVLGFTLYDHGHHKAMLSAIAKTE